jgi:hypothetical protein
MSQITIKPYFAQCQAPAHDGFNIHGISQELNPQKGIAVT